ncbi:MAG: DHA2 family efflux MFS transporter permease subunit [Pseudomonadota bacterium]
MATASAAMAPQPGVAALPVGRRGLLTIGVMGATIMQILDSTIANVALKDMQAALGATADTVTWVLTSFIVASAVAIPITGWLSDRFGSRNLFLAAVGGFIAASMLCGLATGLEEMVAFRILQGIFAAFINPLSQTVMLDINPPERQAKAMSIWGMGIMVGPIMGPVIGGWLTDNYNWRWVFYVNLPIGIVCLAILWALLPTRPRNARRFDLFGFTLLAVAIASFQLMLDRGQSEDWFQSGEVIVEGCVALAAAWMFVVHLFTGKNPMFDRELFANRNLVTSLGFMLVVGVMTMATMALLPPMLQRLFGYPVLDTGLLLMPRGVGVVVTMALSAAFVTRGGDPRLMIAGGLLICAYSLWEMTHWTLAMGAQQFVVVGFVQGLGMGMVFMPLNAMAFATLPPHYRTEGSSLMNLARSIGASAGISAVTAVLARNIQTNHMELGGRITTYSLDSIDPSITSAFGSLGQTALALLDLEVNRQAAMIAYLNDFKLIMILNLIGLPLLFLMRRPPRKPGEKVELTVSE